MSITLYNIWYAHYIFISDKMREVYKDEIDQIIGEYIYKKIQP